MLVNNEKISIKSETVVITLNEIFISGPSNDIDLLNKKLGAYKYESVYVFDCENIPTKNGIQFL